MKPEAHEIIAAARKLKDERFSMRNAELKKRSQERYNETQVEVPDAYKVTAQQHSSNIINDEIRQIATLVYAWPIPHIAPPSPEDQHKTTLCEQFLDAMLQQLQDHYGPVWEQCTEAQVDDKIGWIFFAPKRKPYKGQPKPAADDDDEMAKYESGRKIERYKQDAGISALFDYEYATTATVLHEGNVFDPHCLYVWKEVPISTFKKTYGENVPGFPEQINEATVNVVEYWDREDCVIVAETKTWLGIRRSGQELDSWTHGWGRVPYFARPCFVTKELEAHKQFASPVDGIYNEMPSHKRLRTMMDAVAYQTAFSPMKITTKEMGESIVDDSGNQLLYIKPKPGEALQLKPGQDIGPIGQSPEIGVLAQETMASQQRIERFTLSPVAKGISPGADTANAALSNLHRFQLSTLDPLTKQTARQASSMFRFALERIRDLGETVYVYSAKTDAYLSLSPEDIVSINVQVKALPDQGQQQLLIEKHALEMWQLRFWDKKKAYETTGIENPEDLARAVEIEDYATTLKPIIWQQVTAMLGMTDAINQMIQANAQTGSAENAILGLVQQAAGAQNGEITGMGQGAAGAPRGPGVRMPVEAINTQQAMENGVGY